MRNTKYLLFAGLGAAAIILLTSDKTKKMREDLKDNAMKNAKKWKEKLSNISVDTSGNLAGLKSMLGNEIEGLSDDVRQRMEQMLNDTTTTATSVKKNVSRQLS